MTMPVTLTWVRHGKSESNETNSLARKGTPHPNEAALKKVHTSRRRLWVPLGVEQARRAGQWVLEDMKQRAAVFGHEQFANTKFFSTPYVRGLETGLEMRLGVRWKPDARLCERNWGVIDNLTHQEHMTIFKNEIARREIDADFWMPRDGETLLEVKVRLRQFFDMLNRQFDKFHVYCSSHGETMWAARSMLEYWMPDEFADRLLNEDSDLQNKMFNCRIVQYSRQYDDSSPELSDHLVRVRLINTQDPDDPKTNLDWQPITQREFDEDELRRYVNKFPHFLR